MSRYFTTLSFTEDPFDQWRAAEVGAVVVMGANGRPFWRFDSKEQFQRYMELNSKRQEWEERRKAKTGNADQEEVRS